MARTVAESIMNTLNHESRAISTIADELDFKAAEKVINALLALKGKVVVAGCGTSGAAAKKIAHTLNCINKPAVFLSPADAVHGGLGVVCAGDMAILLSKGGATPEITKLLPAIKAKGALSVAITENEDSQLARECDILLKVRVESEPDNFNMLATASTLGVISVMDAVAICVMDRSGFSKEQFALIHPSGAVGDRLLGKSN